MRKRNLLRQQEFGMTLTGRRFHRSRATPSESAAWHSFLPGLRPGTTYRLPFRSRSRFRFRDLDLALSLLLGLLTATLGIAAEPTPAPALVNARQIRELSPGRADSRLAAELNGVLTLVDHPRYMCFLQDETGGVFLELERELELHAGQRIRASGTTRAGRLTPFLQVTQLTVLGDGPLPQALPAEPETFKAGFLEGDFVSVEGRVVSVERVDDRLRLRLYQPSDAIVAWVTRPETVPMDTLLQSQLRVQGVCAGVFNERDEIVDFHLHAANGSALTVIAPAPSSPTPQTAQSIKSLELDWHNTGLDQVRCVGQVTLSWPGRHLFISDGSSSLEVRTDKTERFEPGDVVEAVGLRTVARRRMIISEATVRRLRAGPPMAPTRTSLAQIRATHRHGDLVQLEGDIVELGPLGDEWIASSPFGRDLRWSMVVRQTDSFLRAEIAAGTNLLSLAALGLGSRVRVEGVLAAQPAVPGEPVGFHLLVPNPNAIQVLRRAPWWTMSRVLWLFGGTGLVLLSGAGWTLNWNQRHRRKAEQAVRRQQEKAIRHRDTLLEIARLVQSPDQPDILQRIAELVARALGIHRVSIWRMAEDHRELHCQELLAGTTHESGASLRMDDFPAYFAALQECRIIAADDARTDPRTREFTDAYLQPNRIYSMLDVPIRFHGRASGVLCIERTDSAAVWDVEEQNFAAAVADQLTILREAGERARAEYALRQAHAELEVRVLLRTTELAEARDRAEAADRVKSAFLASMSHELRTPLNSILGFTGILLQGLVGSLNPEQSKQLTMVQKSARHLLSLINDVLDISKIEAGQVEIKLEPFDVREAVHRVVDLVRPLAARKNLELRIGVAPQVDRFVSDRRRVEQILINLLNNAIKFTDSGSVRVECDAEEPGLRFRVADTGIGIRSEHLPLLFKPFRQLDTGLARQHEGTGLGLAICAGLTARLGGKISVASEHQKGSVFSLELPRGHVAKHEDRPDHRG